MQRDEASGVVTASETPTGNPWRLPHDHPDAAGADSVVSLRLAFAEVWDAGHAAAEGREDPEPRPADAAPTDQLHAVREALKGYWGWRQDRLAGDAVALAAVLNEHSEELWAAICAPAAGGASAVPPPDATAQQAADELRHFADPNGRQTVRLSLSDQEYLNGLADALDRAAAVPVDRPRPRVTVDGDGDIWLGPEPARGSGTFGAFAVCWADGRPADDVREQVRAALADRPQVLPEGMTSEATAPAWSATGPWTQGPDDEPYWCVEAADGRVVCRSFSERDARSIAALHNVTSTLNTPGRPASLGAAGRLIAGHEGAAWDPDDFAEPWMATLAHAHYEDIAQQVIKTALGFDRAEVVVGQWVTGSEPAYLPAMTWTVGDGALRVALDLADSERLRAALGDHPAPEPGRQETAS